MTSRGERTREQLLDVAEQLFGTEGVRHVSLRQVRIAAGQGNERVVQYHFGDRDGLLKGLSDRHGPHVLEVQKRILANVRPGFRGLVNAFVRPLTEYCTMGRSERAWLKIIAELWTDPKLSHESVRDSASDDGLVVGLAMYHALSERVGPELAAERLWAVSQFVFQTVADRARLLDEPAPARLHTSDEVFADNLVDMAYGALTARVTRGQKK